MADNKKYKANRQKADELIEKLGEGMKQMDALRSAMEAVWQAARDLAEGMEDAMYGLQEKQEPDRQKEDEQEKTYQKVEVFGVPALFDNARIPQEDVPEGLCCYDLRGSDSDPGEPVTVERHVVVNHAASILTAVPLPVPEQGFLRLGEGLNFIGGMMAVREFMEEYAGMNVDSLMENMEDAICRENEELFLNPSAEYGRYAIYQINEDIVKDNYLFMSLELVKSRGIKVSGEDYSLIYGGRLSRDVTLEMLYEKFNIDHPEGFQGHSLSVSDVVVTNRGGEVKAYYVDSFGYAELPEFVKQRQDMMEQTSEEQMEKDIDYGQKAEMPLDNDLHKEDSVKYPAFYPHPASYAAEHGEQELFRASHNVNIACKEAIDDALKKNFDGMRLNPDALRDVLDEYSEERIACVLSATLQQHTWDGRFSRSNQEWAEQVCMPDNMVMGRDFNCELVLFSHSVLVNGFVDLFRKELRQRENAIVLETEQAGTDEPGQTITEPELEDADELIDLGDEREKVLAEMKGILEGGGKKAEGLMESEEEEQAGEKEDDTVTCFKAKTEELFHSISDMNPSEIEETVKCHVQEKIDESGMDAAIVNVAIAGSRCRGLEKDGSDLDVVVELSSNEREDVLFDTFNGDALHIGGVKVDINPITAQRTGTLDVYLPQVEEYLEELRRARENEPVSLFNIRMNGAERWYKNTSGLNVKGLCKAYAECGNPFADMGRFGERMGSSDYTDIEQGERLDFSIEFNGETDKVTIFDGTDFICRGMREMLFIQKMEDEPDAAAELAVRIDCLSYDCDAVLYRESAESMEKNVSDIAEAVRQGDTAHLTKWLADIIENGEEPERMERAVEILKELNDYKPFAQVEEMEEQSCNMIDNALNNGAGEKVQKEENKKLQEKPAGRVSLKERLAQKQAIVSSRGKEPQEGIEKKHREM